MIVRDFSTRLWLNPCTCEVEMGPVTAIRSMTQAPPIAIETQADQPSRRHAYNGAAAPVAEPLRLGSVFPPAGTAAIPSAHLAERDTGLHPASEARAAADAAKRAYIKASIAAGVSPLPLP